MQDQYTSEYHMAIVRVIRKFYCFQLEEEVGKTIDQFWIEHEKILVQDRFIRNIIHMEKFCHKIWKITSVAQSICKAIHQGRGTGWLPSYIKYYWRRNF